VSNNSSDLIGRIPGGRKLVAVVYIDMVGYSRLIELNDGETLERLRSLRRFLIDPAINEHGGRIVQTAGDSLLIMFDSIDGAVRFSVHMQQQVPEYDRDQPSDRAIRFRVGINIGDVIADGTDLHGDSVNVAVRLQAECPSGGICVSRAVRDHVHGRLALGFEELGALNLKNIIRPVEAFVLRFHNASTTPPNSVPRSPVQSASETLLPDKPSIAVLTFANMSSDPEQEFFSDGIAEDIITILSNSPALFVIARNSSFAYKGRVVDVRTAGRELGVRYILEGSVRKSGSRVRVTAQLIEAATAAHIWAERFDRDVADIFAVQDDITARVSATILPVMERSERERAVRRPPNDLDAWECYHRGMWHFSKTEPLENVRARELFQRAITLDPGFSAAHAGLAFTYQVEGINFRELEARDETIPHAIEHARQSIAANPADGAGHAALASALQASGQHREAMIEASLAVSLAPNSALAAGALGYALAFGGQPREAVEHLKKAILLSPFDPQMSRWLSHIARSYYLAGDYEAAIATGQRLCRSFPKVRAGYRTLIAAFGQMAQVELARSLLLEAEQRFGSAFFGPMIARAPELSEQAYCHMVDGYRKAGWNKVN
jgi:adenylate cyclase